MREGGREGEVEGLLTGGQAVERGCFLQFEVHRLKVSVLNS